MSDEVREHLSCATMASAKVMTDCLEATDQQLWQNDVLAWCQARLDSCVSSYVPEPPPAPPVDPMAQFLPASSIGKIQSPVGLIIAQGARMRMRLDSGRLVMYSSPIPV